MKDTLPLLSELIDEFDNGNIPVNHNSWFKFYLTEDHKNSGENYAGFMAYSELEKYSKYRRIRRKRISEFMWGKLN